MRSIRIASAFVFLLLSSVSVRAWDAGPAKCKHSECGGGAEDVWTGVPDTQPKWANSVVPSSRVADCPAGYTNNGATCGRGADSIANTTVTPSCPPGYTNTGLTCYQGPDTYGKCCTTIWSKDCNCRPGYTDNGCTCGKGASTISKDNMICPAGYYLDKIWARCRRTCPDGYKNMGESCFRDVSTLGMESMSCNAGETKSGARCYTCPADRELYGLLCYAKCPAGSKRTAVSTCVHDIKWRGNTHLFMVNKALSLLKSANDPIAKRAYDAMDNKDCRHNWEDGIWDADAYPLYEAPDGRRGTHFYDGSGKDQRGNPTSVVTYEIAGAEQKSYGNARETAKKYIDAYKVNQHCSSIGLALHFATDMTQPMHATTFSAAQIPLSLHPAMEEYVPSLHSRIGRPAEWDRRWAGKGSDEVFDEMSKKSASLAPALWWALSSGDFTMCTMTPEVGVTYSGYCFLHDPKVDEKIIATVQDGIQSTASYIYAVFKEMP